MSEALEAGPAPDSADETAAEINRLMAGEIPGYQPRPQHGVTPPSSLSDLIIGATE